MTTIEDDLEENTLEKEIEKEVISMRLKEVDTVRSIIEKRYPSYGILKDFIDHLASTEKVFILAGIKKFGGDEIMELFIESETEVMASDTGIDKDVFSHIKEEFSRTHKTISGIKSVADKLRERYPQGEKFIAYIEDYLILLLEASRDDKLGEFDIDKEKEKTIHEMMVEIAENDKAEIEELEKIYQEFKEELKKTTD